MEMTVDLVFNEEEATALMEYAARQGRDSDDVNEALLAAGIFSVQVITGE